MILNSEATEKMKVRQNGSSKYIFVTDESETKETDSSTYASQNLLISLSSELGRTTQPVTDSVSGLQASSSSYGDVSPNTCCRQQNWKSDFWGRTMIIRRRGWKKRRGFLSLILHTTHQWKLLFSPFPPKQKREMRKWPKRLHQLML